MPRLLTHACLAIAALLLCGCNDSSSNANLKKQLPSFRASIGSVKAPAADPVIEDGIAVKPAPSRRQPKINERLSVYCYSTGSGSAGIAASHGRVITRAEMSQQWVDDALARSARTGENVVVIDKTAYRLHLVEAGEVKASYFIELGANPVDDKRMEGDMCTPEGVYYAQDKRDTGETMYYRGFLLSYPNEDDRREFNEMKRTGQVPADATIGGGIMLHGLGSGKSPEDGGDNWTHGCIALSDEDMDAVFPLINPGTRIVITTAAKLDGK